jgi:hypothetical protein
MKFRWTKYSVLVCLRHANLLKDCPKRASVIHYKKCIKAHMLKLVSRPIRIDSKDDRCRRIEARVVDRGYVEAGRKFCRCIALHTNVGDVSDVGRKQQNFLG